MGKKKKTIYNVVIACSKCSALLFRYAKEGSGHLVKCYVSNITDDQTGGKLECQWCGQVYAREGTMHGRPVRKIVQGKVTVRGHVKT